MNSPYETNRHTHKGFTITVKWFSDDHMGPPWKAHDGHGIVTEWTVRNKAPGERLLCEDRSQRQYYDLAGTMRKAKLEGWGLGTPEIAALAARLGRTPKPGDILAEAVERDFRYLRDWCNDKWHWCGYQVTVETPDGDELSFDHPEDSLWGIDSPSMEQFEAEALEIAQDRIDRHLAAAERESLERFDMACRDTVTA